MSRIEFVAPDTLDLDRSHVLDRISAGLRITALIQYSPVPFQQTAQSMQEQRRRLERLRWLAVRIARDQSLARHRTVQLEEGVVRC